ncbi:integrin alpha-PS5 [Dendroctonus ponderosae]|uniref:integrin alpha-PS5 n=1 Tax=Dendroctonus ponderosae TaxID=77166 RepID=UPI0020351655|nr:integrin alpha-PS5 [Dendroctonus ponderosae]
MNLKLRCGLFFAYLSFQSSQVNGYSFNVEDVIVISNDFVKNTYFSYSLLLQVGDGVSLIVGAPKNVANPDAGGDVYNCAIKEDSSFCTQYPFGRSLNSTVPNGNFLGMSMDGDSHQHGPVVICAPRTRSPDTKPMSYFTRGYCLYMKNSSLIYENPAVIAPTNAISLGADLSRDLAGKLYYNLAFAMAGFDVFFASPERIILGSPGVKKFSGAIMSYSVYENKIIGLFPKRAMRSSDEDTYFGYSTIMAHFIPQEAWYVAGAPRANDLKGKVTIFSQDINASEESRVVASFEGEEPGAYFGSTLLAVDVSNDQIVDLLIGAPTAAGKTWDEGSVYFYKGTSAKSFLRGRKLTGLAKIGGRFGSAMAAVGDFDLDGFNDVAIAAPYEDDGAGAVYIYRGSTEGLTNHFSQRISPSDFHMDVVNVKGFGMGLSKGNDIDRNGHNDIAIGAYKSDQAFILKSFSIIDYQAQLYPDIASISNETDSFKLNFCILYTERSAQINRNQMEFQIVIDLDYRSVVDTVSRTVTASSKVRTCTEFHVELKKIMNISPFTSVLSIETSTKGVIAHGEKTLNSIVPYSHGCGDDNICNTFLTLQLKASSNTLVLGLNKEISLDVKVQNDGEPAYQCSVKLHGSDELLLRNAKDCTKNDDHYTCPFNEYMMLVGSIQKTFIFDVLEITPDVAHLDFKGEVACLGVNDPTSKTETELQIPVVLHSVPYIIGKSVPESAELSLKSHSENVEVLHQFSLEKHGPSPLRIDVDLFIPVDQYNGINIFNVTSIHGATDNIGIDCMPSAAKEILTLQVPQDLPIAVNRTFLISCGSDYGCIRYSCKGEFLYQTAELAIFEIRTLVDMDSLALKYKSFLTKKDIIAYVPVAHQATESGGVAAWGVFLFFAHSPAPVPLWVFLLGPIIASLLLVLISFGLYKCHFFERNYKAKLEQEKEQQTLIVSDSDTQSQSIDDDIVLRNNDFANM